MGIAPSTAPSFQPSSKAIVPVTQAPTVAIIVETYTQDVFGSDNLILLNETQKKWCEDKMVEEAYLHSLYPTVNYKCTITNQKIDVLNRLRRKLNTNTNTRRLTVTYDLETSATNRNEAVLANNGVVKTVEALGENLRQFLISIDDLATEVGHLKSLTPSQPSCKPSDGSSLQPMSNPTIFPFMVTSKPHSKKK